MSNMPSGKEMLMLMNSFSFAYKFERALSNYLTMVMWASLSEILLFIGFFFTFCTAPKRIGVALLQVVHLARGVFGILYIHKLPRTHDLLDDLKYDTPIKSLEEVKEQTKYQLIINVLTYVEINKIKIRLYSIGTLVCLLMDTMLFCVQYRWFIEGTADHTNMWMMFVTLGFLIYDSVHIFYLLSMRRTMPDSVNAWLLEAAFGDITNLYRQLKLQLQIEEDDDYLKDQVSFCVDEHEKELEEAKLQREELKKQKA